MYLWLLTIEYAGRSWRWASAPCSPMDGASAVPHYGGLDIDDVPEAADILGVAVEPRSIPLSLQWPIPGVAEIVSQGHEIEEATAELSRWREGDTYGQREVMIEGYLDRPIYGAREEPVTCSLQEEPWQDSSLIPDVLSVVDIESWPSADPSMLGRTYPLPFGLPGHITGRTAIARDIPGTMAPRVGVDLVLLSGWRVLATSVWVFDSTGSYASVAVTYQTDGRGRYCAVADISASLLTLGEAEYGIAWPTAGGIAAPDGGELQRAGDLLLYLLSWTSLRIDRHQIGQVADTLNSIVVAGAIESRCEAWQWVQDHLLPLLPVSQVASGSGLRLIPWHLDRPASHAVDHLRAGHDCSRLTSIDTDTDEIANECTVRFALNDSAGGLENSVTVHGGTASSPAEHVIQSAILSRQRRGSIPTTPIDADIIASERAAIQVAIGQVTARARAPRTISYRRHVGRLLDIGALVLVTDPDVSLSSARALVQERIRGLTESVIYTLVLL